MPSTATIPAPVKEYAVSIPYDYNGKRYRLEYKFKDLQDEEGNYLLVHIKTFITEENKEREVGGSHNNVTQHFIGNVLNAQALRREWEQKLSKHIRQENI